MTKKTIKKSVDRPFNVFRRCKSDAAKSLAVQIASEYVATETRGRNRKAKDQIIFDEQIEAIISDAVHRYLTAPKGRVAFSSSNQILGNPQITDAPLLNKAFPETVKRLADPTLGYLSHTPGSYKDGLQSTFAATAKLANLVSKFSIQLSDLTVTKERDPIQLRATKKTGEKKGRSIKFEDDKTTNRYRSEMQRINEFLADANIEYHGKGSVDESQRSLYRVFNRSSFTKGGRIYGGFWINIKSKEIPWITIDEEPVIYLDYGQVASRLTYWKAGLVPSFEDAYCPPDIPKEYREAVKKLTNNLLNRTTPLEKLPKEFKKYPRLRNTDGQIDQKATASAVINSIIKFHEPIAEYFFKEGIFSTMFIESEIMVRVLLSLIDQNIVALCKHDGLLVKESDADVAREVMSNVSKDYLGFALPVHHEISSNLASRDCIKQ